MRGQFIHWHEAQHVASYGQMARGNDVIGPINIGNPKDYAMPKLAEKTLELANSKSKIAVAD